MTTTSLNAADVQDAGTSPATSSQINIHAIVVMVERTIVPNAAEHHPATVTC
jgi:hypothetical protein